MIYYVCDICNKRIKEEPVEVKDDWGAGCGKWKPIEKAVSNQ